jgi:hypothetical protein
MVDSSATVLVDTAHSYMECSNKGICDRKSGSCGCFDGYSGSACQYAACPVNANGVCSGHGNCISAKSIAAADNNNVYELWDEASTMGCICDTGYSGADCSERTCKHGADPLYYDDIQNARVPNTTYIIYSDATNTGANGPSGALTVLGNYAIIFTDNGGKAWQTVPISIGAECADTALHGIGIINALEGLPNNIVPRGSVRCLRWDGVTTTSTYTEPFDANVGIAARINLHTKFSLVLTQNAGKLLPLRLNFYLDGSRPTLYSNEAVSTLSSYVFSNGFTGEDVDYVPDLCSGVTVTLTKNLAGTYYVLAPGDANQIKLLKTCLGDADGNAANNKEVNNWDYGDSTNPHLIKLIETTETVPSYIDTKQCHNVTNISPMTHLCDVAHGTLYTTSAYTTPTTATTSTTFTKECNNFNPPGFFAVMVWDGTSEFRVYTRGGQDYLTVDQNGVAVTTTFNVFTTTGYLHRVSSNVDAYNLFAGVSGTNAFLTVTPFLNQLISNTVYTTKNDGGAAITGWTGYDGNVDCAESPQTNGFTNDCIKKGDMVMLVNTDMSTFGLSANPVYPQIYTVEKVSKALPSSDTYRLDSLNQIVLDMPVNAVYTSFRTSTLLASSGARVLTASGDTSAGLFKFYPPPNGGEKYSLQCSGRGICGKTTGVCQCFPGYTADNCGVMDALSM